MPTRGSYTLLSRSCLQLWIFLLLLDFSYQLYFQHSNLSDAWITALIESLACSGIFLLTRQVNLARLTLIFLALPYLLFIPGWLNLPVAILTGLPFLYALSRVWRLNTGANPLAHRNPDRQEITAFLLIVLWVHMSGSGGYSYQSFDYEMHNGRLRDLAEMTWPIRYGENANLVYYVGYYLPSAMLGKLFGNEIATRSMLPWTLLGVTLTVRWLCELLGRPLSCWLAITFILFGPQDLLGYLGAALQADYLPRPLMQWSMWETTDDLDFLLSIAAPHFIGNFLSNTFQLYWAPHQIIAGWLCAALGLRAYLARSNASLVFSLMLLCLWAPMIMVAIAPLIGFMITRNWLRGCRELLSFPNLFASVWLAPIFLLFYTSGSALHNPIHWIVPSLPQPAWLSLTVFYLLGWGLYAMACISALLHSQHSSDRVLLLAVCTSFILISQILYGAWSDLLCRGAAPLSFLLFFLVMRAWKTYEQQQRHIMQVTIILLLIAGSGSAIVHNHLAIKHYGKQRSPIKSHEYSYAYEFIGPDDSLFGRYLRRQSSP